VSVYVTEPSVPAIEVDGLVQRYGAVTAVDGLTLEVRRGEVFGLLGPNGAGKTTTVETLEGYRRPSAGSVKVLGLDPVAEGVELRPRIGVMLQEGGIYPGVRPLEVLDLFASYYEQPDDPARLLSLVGLDEARGTLVRRLSGGQRQRLSLALALIGRPELVFLDEPTAGMDPHARSTTWRLVRDLSDAGVSVVLTTHAMDEAEHLCDRIAIIDHGRLVTLGTPAELTLAGAGDETRFTAPPGIDGPDLAAHLRLPPDAVREERPGEYLLTVAADPDLVVDLAVYLRDHGLPLSELRTTRHTLEEVFLRLTGDRR